MSFMALSNAIPHVKAGKLRALGVTTSQRSAELPGVPTMVEAGLPGFVATAWLALVAPKGTPPAVVTRLNNELQKIMLEPETVKTLSNAGFDVELAGPDELGSYLRDESGKWLQLARNMNLSQ
jgi:tripartite-type tricarboxylate transporter receptor subunit TctC